MEPRVPKWGLGQALSKTRMKRGKLRWNPKPDGVMGHFNAFDCVKGDNIRPWAAFSCQKPRRTSQSRTTCFRLRPLRTRRFDPVMRPFMTVRIGEAESERSRSRSSTRAFYDADEEATDCDKPRSRTLMLPSTLRIVMRNRVRPLRTSE